MTGILSLHPLKHGPCQLETINYISIVIRALLNIVKRITRAKTVKSMPSYVTG